MWGGVSGGCTIFIMVESRSGYIIIIVVVLYIKKKKKPIMESHMKIFKLASDVMDMVWAGLMATIKLMYDESYHLFLSPYIYIYIYIYFKKNVHTKTDFI